MLIKRLLSSQLPDEDRIHDLVAAYFANVHPLRSFAFIYKPSFLEKLDRGLAKNSKNSSLLHIICALGSRWEFDQNYRTIANFYGSRFYALDKLENGLDLDSNKLLPVGNAWAETAKQLLFRDMSQISVENLMVSRSHQAYHFLTDSILGGCITS